MSRSALVCSLIVASLAAACGQGRVRPDVIDNPGMMDGGIGELDVMFARDVQQDVICVDGQTVCGMECKALQDDPRNCGACGNDCTRLPGVIADQVRCRMGVCDLRNACPPGRGFCEGEVTDGCATDLTRPERCGACDRMCAEPTPACTMMTNAMGQVQYACAAGCMGSTPTRCAEMCVDTMSNPEHCGRCGTACNAPAGARGVCTAGRCGFECNPGFFDCDGDPSNGCEVDGRTDPTNCGRCRNSCPNAPNGMPSCSMGLCGVACTSGFLNCDGMNTNGCEINGQSNTSNCGMCGNACRAATGSAPRCNAGMCELGCMTGTADCDGDATNGCETNTATGLMNCGGCGMRCPMTAANGTPVCEEGMCRVRCNPGFADCDSDPMNGCEARVSSDVMNCGVCGRACEAGMNQTATCNMGTCAVACRPGFTDCDRDPANGCEANFQNDPRNCGTCGTMCTGRTNAPPTCTAGSCVFACAMGFADCDRTMSNGCEVETASSASNCGTCGTVCPAAPFAGAACAGGVCDINCEEMRGNCDRNTANGCETLLGTDRNNCGSCGRICTNGTRGTGTCRMGSCGFICEAGYGDCDSDLSTGCEQQLTAITHCGRCGNDCTSSTPANTTAACMTGMCRFTCRMGFADCDMDIMSNGCEVDTRTSMTDCGGCGRPCGDGQTCVAGACR